MARQGPLEVALSSDLSGAPYSFSLWDICTGAQLVVFKGIKGNPISRCLQLVDKGYFVTAIDNVVQIWSIHNRKSQEPKLFLPGRPSSLAITPCCNYLIAGISEMIYIWQLCSGNLVAHTQRHYQTVTTLKINQEGTFLFSGAEDGMVLVWPLGDLISSTYNTGSMKLDKSRNDTGVNEPRFTWQHHSARVTDIHVSNGGRCVTTSLDKTVNIYSYVDGERLHCISDWPSPLWSVVINKNETVAFFGGQDGNIYKLALSSLGLSMINSNLTQDEDEQRSPVLTGHKDRITNLLISMDGSLLISGSLDSTCKVWDIYQGKMIRDIKHQAPIGNLVSMIIPEEFSLSSMTQSETRPPLLVKRLKRNIYKANREVAVAKEDIFEEATTTLYYLKNDHEIYKPDTEAKDESKNSAGVQGIIDAARSRGTVKRADDSVVEDLKKRLKKLYELSTEKIFKDVATESLRPAKKIRR